jgi:hypothetical protein
MSTVVEIESAIQKLDSKELTELSRWFEEFVANAWDEQIEADAKAGKLDHFKDEIAKDRAAGKLIDFP